MVYPAPLATLFRAAWERRLLGIAVGIGAPRAFQRDSVRRLWSGLLLRLLRLRLGGGRFHDFIGLAGLGRANGTDHREGIGGWTGNFRREG